MKTLLLDQTLWDLCLDASRNIAVASDPYASAQDVASALRLFKGELYYDTALGVPYFGQILGEQPTLEFMEAQFVQAALRVPGIVSATAAITSLINRQVQGQVRVTDKNGVSTTVAF